MTRRRGRLAAAGACALGVLLLSGCHTSAKVAVRVRADGSGTIDVEVTLDRAARVAVAGGSDKPGLPDIPLDDLRARGWTTSERAAADGGEVVRLEKPFVGVAGLTSAFADLDGRSGALRDVRVVRTRSLLRDRDGVSLLADLRHLRAGVADDAALAARLRAAGIDVAALDAGLSARIKGSFDLTVSVVLPDGRATAIRVVPGQQQSLSIASSVEHTGRRFALAGAGIAAFLGLALIAFAGVRSRRARSRPMP
jgi:hypothetical protein